MKTRHLFLTTLLIVLTTAAFAQDYEVRSIEHLPMDMTAKVNQLTEKPNGGQPCAVLRIATQNILAKDRNAFQFNPDMGSRIRERHNEGGEILLWVSPGINYLKIKHKDLGNLVVFIPELLHGEVESLNTYRILIVGTKELPKEPTGFGSCQIFFKPTPEDATVFLNGDSIGSGNCIVPTIAGTYQWTITHPLYHSETGTVELSKRKTDTVVVALTPAFGYMKIIDDYGLNEEVKVYVDGKHVGNMPYVSEKMASGVYQVAFEKGDTILANSQIEVKDNHVSVEGLTGLFYLYRYKRQYINDPQYYKIADSLSHIVHTRFVPITGTVNINSTPQSTVNIDGVDYGQTPITINTLPVGMHSIVLSGKGCEQLVKTIAVKENEETDYFFRLPRACILTITSDKDGDLVYFDGDFVGGTPVTIERPFGDHKVFLRRIGKFQQEKTIHLSPDDLALTMQFTFGQHVNVEADRDKNRVYLNGDYIGKTPVDIYLPYGTHKLTAERGWKTGSLWVNCEEDQTIGDINIDTYYDQPTPFLSNGAFFMTGNVAIMNNTGKPVYGFNIGDICDGGNAGWYFSFMANRNFINQINKGFSSNEESHSLETNSDGNAAFRGSALFGVALKVAGPVYLRIGAGAGIRDYWEKNKETSYQWKFDDSHSWGNAEFSLGLQTCIYNFVVNADALIPLDVLTESKKLVEFRVGLGYCLKHTRTKRK